MPTEYVVFKKFEPARFADQEDEGLFSWTCIDTVEARSARSAIRHVIDGTPHEGEFAAVPLRSWQPVKVQQETKTALKFS